MLSKIKKEYQTAVVAFGNSGLPLGKRNDLDDLAIIAHKSKDGSLLKLFEVLPSLEELQTKKTDAALPVLPQPDPAPIPEAEIVTQEDPPQDDLPEIQQTDPTPAPEKYTRKKK